MFLLRLIARAIPADLAAACVPGLLVLTLAVVTA